MRSIDKTIITLTALTTPVTAEMTRYTHKEIFMFIVIALCLIGVLYHATKP